MNKGFREHQSTFLDLDANIVVIVMWIVVWALYGRAQVTSFISLAIPIAILLFEKDSELVRVHAGQLCALMLVLNIIQAIFHLSIRILYFFTRHLGLLAFPLRPIASVISVASWLLVILLFIVMIIACVKGYEWKEIRLPLIDRFGDMFNRKIKF